MHSKLRSLVASSHAMPCSSKDLGLKWDLVGVYDLESVFEGYNSDVHFDCQSSNESDYDEEALPARKKRKLNEVRCQLLPEVTAVSLSMLTIWTPPHETCIIVVGKRYDLRSWTMDLG